MFWEYHRHADVHKILENLWKVLDELITGDVAKIIDQKVYLSWVRCFIGYYHAFLLYNEIWKEEAFSDSSVEE